MSRVLLADEAPEVREQDDDLFLAFQPIRHLKSRRVVGYEALPRYTRKPHRWPRSVELAAARAACAQIPGLPAETFMAVNLSPEAASSIQFRRMLSDVPPDRLVIEVREHAPSLDAAFRDLRSLGVRLAIDDVGAGSSSLRHILEVAPEFLKLDRSLTRLLDDQSSRRSLASTLATFATDIGAETVAQGVATENAAQTLLSLDIVFGQGFHLGVPGPLPQGEGGPP